MMISRIIAKSLIAIALSTAFTSVATAQEYDSTPVVLSKEKVRIDGKTCYSHIVLEKQTLYSISKAYNVSIEDIYEYNPSVKENGLKKNSILIIPIAAEEETATTDETSETPQKDNITHIVKWFEDLDVIAEKYGVTAQSIMQLNNLKGRKLARRQKLLIPSPGETVKVETTPVEEKAAVSDTTATVDSSARDKVRDLFSGLFPSKKDAKVSLLMPFKADGITGSKSSMDFYSGALLAIYSLGNEGISIDMNVYDIADGNISIPAEELEKNDMIIGPVSSGDIGRLLETAPQVKALISPLDQRAASYAKVHDNVIQAPVPSYLQYQDLASWIKEDMQPGDRVLVISEKAAKPTQTIQDMQAAIDSSGVTYSPLSYSILEGRNVTGSLEYLMTETGVNRVYITSESEAFVNDVVRNLNIMIYKKYNVVLYATSRIRSFETIEVENFHNTSMHVSLGYYIDYSDSRVMDFLLKYRALFNTEPSQAAFQGYDITRYFIGLYSKYGQKWMEKLSETDMSMLQTSFRFRHEDGKGYTNTGVRRIIYGDDWSVIKVR